MVNVEQISLSQHAEKLQDALRHVKSGGVVVLPTDTLFGLAADVHNPVALSRIFEIKGRPKDLALPVLVNDWQMVGTVADSGIGIAQTLAEKYWPGPLTLVLPRAVGLSDLVTGGRDTVAVRSPDHWVPLWLVHQLGRPITGTSANRSGAPNPSSMEEVRQQLGDSVDCYLDCGPAPLGTASTIVDITGDTPKLLREGAVPFQEILDSLQVV